MICSFHEKRSSNGMDMIHGTAQPFQYLFLIDSSIRHRHILILATKCGQHLPIHNISDMFKSLLELFICQIGRKETISPVYTQIKKLLGSNGSPKGTLRHHFHFFSSVPRKRPILTFSAYCGCIMTSSQSLTMLRNHYEQWTDIIMTKCLIYGA